MTNTQTLVLAHESGELTKRSASVSSAAAGAVRTQALASVQRAGVRTSAPAQPAMANRAIRQG